MKLERDINYLKGRYWDITIYFLRRYSITLEADIRQWKLGASILFLGDFISLRFSVLCFGLILERERYTRKPYEIQLEKCENGEHVPVRFEYVAGSGRAGEVDYFCEYCIEPVTRASWIKYHGHTGWDKK